MSGLPQCLFKFAQTNSSTNNSTTSCVPFAVQVSYFVGVPLIILLVAAILTLSIAVACLSIRLRSSRRRNRNTTSAVEELKADDLEQHGDSMGPEDSFESIGYVVESNRQDTIVNDNYDMVQLKNIAYGTGETSSDTVQHQYTNIKDKKKKTKKNGSTEKKNDVAQDASERDIGYNKLVHGSETAPKVSINLDSYSALDKPKKETEASNAGGVNKVKALPPIPSQAKDLPHTSSVAEASLQGSSADAYVDVPTPTGGINKKVAVDDSNKTGTVYYNETAVTTSKTDKEAEDNKEESEREKRLNIYSQSISLANF